MRECVRACVRACVRVCVLRPPPEAPGHGPARLRPGLLGVGLKNVRSTCAPAALPAALRSVLQNYDVSDADCLIIHKAYDVSDGERPIVYPIMPSLMPNVLLFAIPMTSLITIVPLFAIQSSL